MKMIDKVALIYLEGGKILSTRSRGKEVYYLPGGKREAGESDLETLSREIKEELSVEMIPASAERYGVFEAQAHGKAEGVLVKMTCYTAAFEGTLRADSEIAELAWLQYRDRERVSPVDKLIFEDLHDRGMLS